MVARALRPMVALPPPRRALSSSPPDSGSSGSGSSSSSDSGGGEGFLSRLTGSAAQTGAKKLSEKVASGAGWREAFASGRYAQQKAKNDAIQIERMTELAEMETYTFDDQANDVRKALKQMDEDITTFQRAQLFADKMQGGNTSDVIEKRKTDFRLRLSILDEFNEHERRVPKLLDWRARAAIARKLNIEPLQVDDVIFQFQLQYAQWAFLRREQLRGRKIPTSAEELEMRMRNMPTREFIEVMNVFRSRKQMLEEARPGYTPPPNDMHINSAQKPLKIRPYISSSHKHPDRRKPPPKPRKRVGESRLL